jgi:maleylpyruvate isomerase
MRSHPLPTDRCVLPNGRGGHSKAKPIKRYGGTTHRSRPSERGRSSWSARAAGGGKFSAVTTDPLALLPEVDRATARFLDTASTLTDAELLEPSLLPGWTRGHVMTHVARNADSLINLLNWARTGVETRQYASPEERTSGIENGARRPIAVQLNDAREAAERFGAACAELSAAEWMTTLADAGPAAKVVWRRLREVEVHHVDLTYGYTWRDWPNAFSHRLLHELVAMWPDYEPAVLLQPGDLTHPLALGSGDAAMTVTGRAGDVAAWLIGRSTGIGLTVSPDRELPAVPKWM